MEFSIRRVNALFKKEVKDLIKNRNVSIMYILPIVFSIIFSKMIGRDISSNNEEKINVIITCISMNIIIVSSYVMSMLIAEEKEKNALRTLMISGLSPLEFFTGKALITFVTTEIINVVIFFIFNMNIQYLGAYTLLTTLVVFSMIEIGGIIGIISPNQMATGVVGIPVLMIFYMIPVFASFNIIIAKVAKLLPNYNMNIILQNLFKGEGISTGFSYSITVILVWVIMAAAAFAYTYNKIGLDK
ncbi:ABC transporter permease [Clostridium bowmanii]|uniref:ABC transporter permease n=1 Tax=Clostridium bowmanii TaxID=132925 RepID=UPI001C0CB699|nr:ABC transporter permease [Clostridium bowmanii]MBU3188304.1 ABC transporter permease [Clostridium bowmanii]MCA1072692.1 ABC transporter permease [Clostridium bowmanii]